MSYSQLKEWIFSLVASDEFIRGLIAIIIILVVTSFVSHAAVRFFEKTYSKATNTHSGTIFALIIRFVIWSLGISCILKYCFNIDATVIWGALGVSGVALSLGLQNTISNLLSGLQISFSKEINLGDWVVIGSVQGEVKDINSRVTIVEDDQGQTHVIPNSVLYSTTVTRKPKFQRVPFTLCIDHKASLEEVQEKICALADKGLEEKGMLFEDKHSVFVFSGSSAEGNMGTLVVYSYWKYATWQIKEAALPPVLSYLEDNDLMGHWR